MSLRVTLMLWHHSSITWASAATTFFRLSQSFSCRNFASTRASASTTWSTRQRQHDHASALAIAVELLTLPGELAVGRRTGGEGHLPVRRRIVTTSTRLRPSVRAIRPGRHPSSARSSTTVTTSGRSVHATGSPGRVYGSPLSQATNSLHRCPGGSSVSLVRLWSAPEPYRQKAAVSLAWSAWSAWSASYETLT